jgi:hypothetical protein
MLRSACTDLPPRYVIGGDNDPRFVCPDEFIEEFVPELWPDDAINVDVHALEGAPGAGLAAALAGADPARLDGDGLLTAISAWRRLASWVKAGESEAVAAFLDRRTSGRCGTEAFESAVSEIQLELTLTGFGAGRLLELACPLSDRLPGTLEALRQGVIDEAKARVIARAVDGVLDAAAAGTVERQVLPKAPAQTTGQLRHAVERAVIQADPEAAERRRRHAEAGRRVEIRPTDAHTADLCGRDLPADQALAADHRITALAKALKHDGDPSSLTFLRARVFLALLLGTGPTPTWPPAADLPDLPADELADIAGEPPLAGHGASASSWNREDPRGHAPGGGESGRHGPSGHHRDTGSGVPGIRDGAGAGLSATVHLIVPIDALRGISDQPGEVPGYGTVPASVARAIASRAADRRWCYSVIDQTGQAIRHGHTKALTGDGDHRELLAALTGKVDGTSRACEVETGCSPETGPGMQHLKGVYRPSASLRHLIEIRDRTCRFPACRRPARQCDLDHTRPFDDGGPTCTCNLAPLCRKHHRLKQAQGWTLTHPEPGRLTWVTPSGRRYPVTPDPYSTASAQQP